MTSLSKYVVVLSLLSGQLLHNNSASCQVNVEVVDQNRNFLYAGIDNTIKLHGLENIRVPTVRALSASLKKIDNISFIIKPSHVKSCKVIIGSKLDTEETILVIEVKPAPEPIVFLNLDIENGEYDVSVIKSIDSIRIRQEVLPKTPMPVRSFTVTRRSKKQVKNVVNKGSKCNRTTKSMFLNAVRGDVFTVHSIYYFDQNKVKKLDKKIELVVR